MIAPHGGNFQGLRTGRPSRRNEYARWLAEGDFKADPASPKPAYAIVMPPPNVTGVLTLGHVLNNTIQDILARRARCWARKCSGCRERITPGSAPRPRWKSISAQRRKRRRDTIWDARNFSGASWNGRTNTAASSSNNSKRLGCSCDWSRERYTFDADYVRAVQRTFVDLYKKGLIYRGRRMVNWDPVALTALSDEEVIPTPQKSTLYYVRYELVEEPGNISRSPPPGRKRSWPTSRWRCIRMTSVIVQSLGKKVWRPLDRAQLPIIGDAAIDPAFGTGVLKVTPAHDKARFRNWPAARVAGRSMSCIRTGRSIVPACRSSTASIASSRARKRPRCSTESGLLAKEEPHESTVGLQRARRRPDRAAPERAMVSRNIRRSRKRAPRSARAMRDSLSPGALGSGLRSTGWRTSRTGASAASSGGAIASRSGIEARTETAGKAIHVDIEPPSDAENWEQDPDVLDTWFLELALAVRDDG